MQPLEARDTPLLGITSVPNLRDVGGARTRDGRMVRTGVLYRSGALHGLDETDMAALEGLGIRRVYDLRGERERVFAPDRVPSGADHVAADVLADWADGGPNRVFGLWDDPVAARRELGAGRAEALWIDQYRRLVTLPSANAAYGRIFRDLASADGRPALIHCSGGKDRTGWAVASLLLLLDVPPAAVMADYLRSGWHGDATAMAMQQALVERGGDPELWRPVFSAEPRYLQAAIDQVAETFGSIEVYFADALDVGRANREALRSAFVG